MSRPDNVSTAALQSFAINTYDKYYKQSKSHIRQSIVDHLE